MSYILNIDTSAETASICLSLNGKSIALACNENRNGQTSWLHPAIENMLTEQQLVLKDIQAIAVAIGPGSYTGLRVGLSAAKGFCYALNIPLITVSTLKMLAYAVQKEAAELICPLIDARRMEVFSCLYGKTLSEEKKPAAFIIDENTFTETLNSHKVLFCGTGSKKLQPLINHDNASFSSNMANASDLGVLSYACLLNKEFADVAYTEPLYIKEFYSPNRKD